MYKLAFCLDIQIKSRAEYSVSAAVREIVYQTTGAEVPDLVASQREATRTGNRYRRGKRVKHERRAE